MDIEIIAEGLRFPEGPFMLPDGSVGVCEIAAGQVTRIAPDGTKSLLGATGGGPNGAAIGPDGRIYVCNNGGFEWFERDGLLVPGHQAKAYQGSSIDAIDITTGAVEKVYTQCDDRPLSGPNDIVFDADGAMWFTCIGKVRGRDADIGSVFYAKADGNMIREAAAPVAMANGIGLSPDGRTLYVAQTMERNLLAFDIIGPGELAPQPPEVYFPGRVVASFPGRTLLDSLAVTASGKVCVATLLDQPGIASIDPLTGAFEITPMPDMFTTNICFGGADMRDAYITLSTTGRLARVRWPEAGLPLHG